MPSWLPGYMAERDRQHRAEISDALLRLTPRERLILREAAVSGYVRGVMHAGGLHRGEVPPDRVMVREALETCIAHGDIYPLLGASA